MTALCGTSVGACVRKILGKLGTNKLWSEFSLKGRKTKLAFKDLAACRIVISKNICCRLKIE